MLKQRWSLPLCSRDFCLPSLLEDETSKTPTQMLRKSGSEWLRPNKKMKYRSCKDVQSSSCFTHAQYNHRTTTKPLSAWGLAEKSLQHNSFLFFFFLFSDSAAKSSRSSPTVWGTAQTHCRELIVWEVRLLRWLRQRGRSERDSNITAAVINVMAVFKVMLSALSPHKKCWSWVKAHVAGLLFLRLLFVWSVIFYASHLGEFMPTA